MQTSSGRGRKVTLEIGSGHRLSETHYDRWVRKRKPEDKLILRERKHGSFKKHFDSVKLTNEDLENMEDIIAEGGVMGNYE